MIDVEWYLVIGGFFHEVYSFLFPVVTVEGFCFEYCIEMGIIGVYEVVVIIGYGLGFFFEEAFGVCGLIHEHGAEELEFFFGV